MSSIDEERLAKLIAKELAKELVEPLSKIVRERMDIDSMSADKLLSAKQAAARIGVSEKTFCKQRLGERIPSVTLPGGAKYFFESRILPALAGYL